MVCFLLAKILRERAVQPRLQPPQPCGEGVLRAGVLQPGWEPSECRLQRGLLVPHRAVLLCCDPILTAAARMAEGLLAPP